MNPLLDYSALPRFDAFRPEHVADMARPPREYIVAKYGTGFFDA